jgi:hypothetical protein
MTGFHRPRSLNRAAGAAALLPEVVKITGRVVNRLLIKSGENTQNDFIYVIFAPEIIEITGRLMMPRQASLAEPATAA